MATLKLGGIWNTVHLPEFLGFFEADGIHDSDAGNQTQCTEIRLMWLGLRIHFLKNDFCSIIKRFLHSPYLYGKIQYTT